jgi:hypothetical protein
MESGIVGAYAFDNLVIAATLSANPLDAAEAIAIGPRAQWIVEAIRETIHCSMV